MDEHKKRGVAAASPAHHEITASRRRNQPMRNCAIATEVSLLLALRYGILFRL
jgi:hypothetical protein